MLNIVIEVVIGLAVFVALFGISYLAGNFIEKNARTQSKINAGVVTIVILFLALVFGQAYSIAFKNLLR